MRNSLPWSFEKEYQSERMKELIADIGMWTAIPGVNYSMNSPQGICRMRENHILFSFIDKYFGNEKFAFEPNMQDGRYVFLPDDVTHQGMGICASKHFPGFLEIGHFWYPCEYTEEQGKIPPGQIYLPMFSLRPGIELANMVKEIYFQNQDKHHHCCTFPFVLDRIATLKDYFLDDVSRSSEIVRNVLKESSEPVKRNGEMLIYYIEHAKK